MRCCRLIISDIDADPVYLVYVLPNDDPVASCHIGYHRVEQGIGDKLACIVHKVGIGHALWAISEIQGRKQQDQGV